MLASILVTGLLFLQVQQSGIQDLPKLGPNSQQTKKPVKKTHKSIEKELADAQMIQEIQELRSRFGGSHFGMSKKEARDLFAKEIQKLSAKKTTPTTSLPSLPSATNVVVPDANTTNPFSVARPANTSTIASIPNRPKVRRTRSWINKRRQVAMKLEQLANELEEMEEYQHADKLREQAKSIRHKCRNVQIIEEKTHATLSGPAPRYRQPATTHPPALGNPVPRVHRTTPVFSNNATSYPNR